MNTEYLDTPNAAIALNFKAGSATLSRAVIQSYYPEIESMITTPEGKGNGTAYPAGKNADNTRWHAIVPKIKPESRPTTLLILRDPIEKFRSACVENEVEDVNHKLDELESIGFTTQVPFWPQSRLAQGNTIKLYRFPQDLEALATEAGLSLPLPHIAGGNDPAVKPNLTPEQTARIEAIYSDDIAFYESITEAGQTYTPPPEPATDELKAQKIRVLESARYQAEVAGITLPDGKFVRTDKETQAELGKALSIISTVNPALEIDWKFPDGSIVSLDAAQIQQIAGTVFAHVQATRTTYKSKAAEVESATTKDELDAIIW